MTDDKNEQSKEGRKNEDIKEQKYRAVLMNRLRSNDAFKDMDLENENTMTLEALYRSEELRKNAETKETLNEEKGTFNLFPIDHIKKNEKKALEKKENQKTPDPLFNIFEVFNPQYQHPKKMCKVNDKCTVLTMRVHPSNNHPEWQVS